MHRNGRSMRRIPIASHEPVGRAWRRSASSTIRRLEHVPSSMQVRRSPKPPTQRMRVRRSDQAASQHRRIVEMHHAKPCGYIRMRIQFFRIGSPCLRERFNRRAAIIENMHEKSTFTVAPREPSRVHPLMISADSADMESDGNRFVSIYSTHGTPRTGASRDKSVYTAA